MIWKSINQEHNLFWLAGFWHFVKNCGVCVLQSKATDDHIDEGDDKHKNCGSIVQDICSLLVFRFIDIKTTDYQE